MIYAIHFIYGCIKGCRARRRARDWRPPRAEHRRGDDCLPQGLHERQHCGSQEHEGVHRREAAAAHGRDPAAEGPGDRCPAAQPAEGRGEALTPSSHSKNSLSKICSKDWVAQAPFC